MLKLLNNLIIFQLEVVTFLSQRYQFDLYKIRLNMYAIYVLKIAFSQI